MKEIILFKCKSCDKQEGEFCCTLVENNPNRDLKTPAYCINDGCGARWVKSKDKRLLKSIIKILSQQKQTKGE